MVCLVFILMEGKFRLEERRRLKPDFSQTASAFLGRAPPMFPHLGVFAFLDAQCIALPPQMLQ